MRSLLQIFALVVAVSALISAPPAVADDLTPQQREERRAEAAGARDVPLIGFSLMDATYARQGGRCRWRLIYVRRASDDLEFYKRYLRANPGTDKVSQADIDRAQRALDREKREPCNPNAQEQQEMTDTAALPAFTGATEPMPSQLPADASLQDRYEEIDAALNNIFQDETKCDVETARRWMENYYRLLREVRMRRDAALGAGGFSNVDAWDANNAHITMRSIVEVAEDRFLRYRIRCAKQPPEEEPQTEGTDRRSSCLPRTGGDYCGGIPLDEDGWPIWEAEETQQAIAAWRKTYSGQPLPETTGNPFERYCRDLSAAPGPGAEEEIMEFEIELLFSFGGCDEFINKANLAVLAFDSSPEEKQEIQRWALQAAQWTAEHTPAGGILSGAVFELKEDEQAMLDVHNEARRDFGVPPLQWDLRLAAGAAEYAKQLPDIGTLQHSPREGREDQRENLLATNIGYRSPAEMIEVMVAEKQYYKPGIYPDISTTGDWYPVGHYSQIVWPWTTHVGCAIHTAELFDWTVCRYSPPGNRDGDPLVPGGNGLPEASAPAN